MVKHFIIYRLLGQLIGASFSITIFFIIIFTSNNFNLFGFHELISNPTVWILFFGYGLMSSIVIAFIGRYIPRYSSIKQVLLYILFGYLPFFVWMPTAFALFAGTIGAFFSLLFLLGEEKFNPSKWYSWIILVIPLVCLLMIPLDFTSKTGWNEIRGDTSVKVEYDFFNGEHLIPIHGEKGEKIYFNVEHDFRHGSNYGMTLYDENGNHEGMNVEEDDDVSSLDFEKETTKYIAVTATDGKQGSFRVKWRKEKNADPK